MSRYAEGSIAGVDLVDTNNIGLRVDLLDGEGLRSTIVSSAVLALDNTVHVQTMATALSGVHFGVRLAQCPVSVRDAIIEAMETAMAAGTPFEVTLADSDGVDDIAVMAVTDDAQKRYSRGSFSGGYVRDVVFRFIATGPVEEMPAPTPPEALSRPSTGVPLLPPIMLGGDLDLNEYDVIGGLDSDTLSIDGGLL